MSEMDVSQVLAQMRSLSARTTQSNEGVSAGSTSGVQFNQLLEESINKVNDTQQVARDLKHAFQAGDESVELPEVMIALQKANISFEAMNQVRNKLLSAYQEIMNMQV